MLLALVVVAQAQLAQPPTKSFSIHIIEHLESTDADVDAKYSETVKTTNPTVLTLSYSDYKITAEGQDIPAPAPEARELHLDKDGRWVISELNGWTSISRLTPELIASWLRGVPIEKGKDANFEFGDPSDPKAKVTGTAHMEGDLLSCELSAITAKFDAPLKIQMKMHMSDGEMDHAEGDVTSMPPQIAGRYNVQSAHFELKRV